MTDETAPTRRRRAKTRVVPGDPAEPSAPADAGVPIDGVSGPATAEAAATSAPQVEEDGSAISAEIVEIHLGAVGQVHADTVEVSRGAIGAARADEIAVELGAVGGVIAGSASVGQGFVNSVLAREVRLDQVVARSIVAKDVTIEGEAAAIFLVAQRITGPVRVLFDWRGAVAFGVAMGLVAGLLGRARGRRD